MALICNKYTCRTNFIHLIWKFMCVHTGKFFLILLIQTEIRLYLPFSDWFGTKRTSVQTASTQIDLEEANLPRPYICTLSHSVFLLSRDRIQSRSAFSLRSIIVSAILANWYWICKYRWIVYRGLSLSEYRGWKCVNLLELQGLVFECVVHGSKYFFVSGKTSQRTNKQRRVVTRQRARWLPATISVTRNSCSGLSASWGPNWGSSRKCRDVRRVEGDTQLGPPSIWGVQASRSGARLSYRCRNYRRGRLELHSLPCFSTRQV